MRPLQVSRYLRQFPSPCSPNRSLLRQADLNSLQTSLRDGRWQVSRYLRQFPSPRSPSMSLFSQARRNSSHCPPTRTPPGPISIDWEKAEIGITKRAAAAAAPSANFRIPFNIPHPPAAGELPVRIHHAGSGISFRPKCTKIKLKELRRNRRAIADDQLPPCVVQSWPRAISQRVVPANAERDDSLKRHAYENSICDGPGRNRLSEARAVMVPVGIGDSAKARFDCALRRGQQIAFSVALVGECHAYDVCHRAPCKPMRKAANVRWCPIQLNLPFAQRFGQRHTA